MSEVEGLFDKLEKEKGSSLTNKEKERVLENLDLPKSLDGCYLDAFDKEVGYNGIKTLKRPYTKLPLTQIHINEIEKCSQDIFYFVRNYCRILTKEGVTFPEFREYQIKFLEILSKGGDVVSSLPRQSGKSVTTALYLLWKALFTKDINIGICANQLSLAMEVLDKIKKIFIQLPIWLQQGLEAWNKTYIVFENGTRIMTSAGNSDSFRGFTCSIIFIDECIEYSSKVTIKYRHLGIEQTLNIGDMYKRMNERDFFIKELLKLEPENEDIIIEYVDFCLLNNTEKIKYETDMHHILPKSYFPEFKSDEKNLTCLTYRNHFLAHKLLALAFSQKSKIVFAFNAMKNKIQPFRKKEDLDNTITEDEYEKIRKNVIVHLKEINKGFVCARLKGEKGNFYQIPIEEFRQNREKYETASDGIFPVYDKVLNKKIRISKEEYRANKERYEIHTHKATFIDPLTKERIVAEKKPEGENFFLHQNTQIVVLRDNKETFIKVGKILEDDIFLYTKKEYQKIQKQKNEEERQKQLEEKRRERELHKDEKRKEGNRRARERELEKRKKLFQEENVEYKKHTPLPSRRRKNKILAYDKIENKNLVVSREDFEKNPDRYEGIIKNTIDVIDLSTNKKIKKHLFDKTKYKKIPRNDKIFLVYNSSDELVFEGNSLETLDFLQNIDPSIKNCRKIYQATSYEDHQRLQQPKAIRGWRIRIK